MPQQDGAKIRKGSFKPAKHPVSRINGAPYHADVARILSAWKSGGVTGIRRELPYIIAILGPNFDAHDLLDYLAERVRT